LDSSEIRSTVRFRDSGRLLAAGPNSAFILSSLLFGLLTVAAVPPLRGPDETAHFLRAYGVAGGDLVPSILDAHGRKGIWLPARVYADFDYFEGVRVVEKNAGWAGYGPVFRKYFDGVRAPMGPQPTFVPYAGSEGYSPVAYLPQATAAAIAAALDLGFLATLYLMRLASLLVTTVLIALAIALLPQLGWALFAIAMLPAATYGRSVISADAMALGTALVATTLWLRGMLFPPVQRRAQLALWLMMTTLTKPTNLVFVLLGLKTPLELSARSWLLVVATILPAIVASLLWSFVSGADVAPWRMVEITGQVPAAFDPAAKISYLLDHPWHFPAAVFASLDANALGELWRQAIGVLGLFDTVLQPWVYPMVSALVLGTFFVSLPMTPAARRQVSILAGATTLAYVAAVYFVCYLAFTPIEAPSIWGVQGRYFIPIFSLLAGVVAALVTRSADERLTRAMAISAAVLSGTASLEAILRVDWHF
jgi:uncharacterized membrane protein